MAASSGRLKTGKTKQKQAGLVKRFGGSIWLFPALLLLPLAVFTVLQISGTSIGTYHTILYGPTIKDPDLVEGSPRDIRSDEWLVGTQQTIAQAKAGFPRINKNIGNGEDMSIIDVPYKDWSTVFRPQNLAFFVMPLDNAFAFKWWLMGYLLIVSCYLFIVSLMPDKRLLAAALSTSLFFGAFVQWWYLYGTLGSIYYAFFIATAVIHLTRQQNMRKKLLWAALLAYLIVCFALILYPPFQVDSGLVVIAFLVGFALQNYAKWGRRRFLQNLGLVIGGGLVAGCIFGVFLLTRADVIKAVQNTAYPGHRSAASGEFFPEHFLASNLGHQFESDARTSHYLIDGKGHTNESEAANFLLLIPFLFIPSILLLYYEYRGKIPLDWPLLALNALFIVLILNFFAPPFTPIAHLLDLGAVAAGRGLIGVGVLNMMVIVLLIRNLSGKKLTLPKYTVAGYCVLILLVELAVSLHAHTHFGIFVGEKKAILLSIPLPVITYLLLTKRFAWAVAGYLVFSVYTAAAVNPLYKGLGTLTANPLSVAVRQLGAHSDKRWATDGGYLENIALDNGERSLSGVYNYPQPNLWDTIPDTNSNVYNRYAHVGIQVSDDPQMPTTMKLIGADSFVVRTNSCSAYLRRMDVGFLLTTNILKSPCLKLQRTVSFPLSTVYIYSVQQP